MTGAGEALMYALRSTFQPPHTPPIKYNTWMSIDDITTLELGETSGEMGMIYKWHQDSPGIGPALEDGTTAVAWGTSPIGAKR